MYIKKNVRIVGAKLLPHDINILYHFLTNEPLCYEAVIEAWKRHETAKLLLYLRLVKRFELCVQLVYSSKLF